MTAPDDKVAQALARERLDPYPSAPPGGKRFTEAAAKRLAFMTARNSAIARPADDKTEARP